MGMSLQATRTRVQGWIAEARAVLYRRLWGMTIGRNTRISGKAFLDFTNARRIHIGDHTIITPGVRIFTHAFVQDRFMDTHIGSCCFTGANSIILPGVRIGDHCVVGAGSVVTRDVPAGCVVAGNPAAVLKQGMTTGWWGLLPRPVEPPSA